MNTKKSCFSNINLFSKNPSLIKQEFYLGFKKAFPIGIGYLPIAMSFGVLAAQTGISLIHTLLMSLMVYAGSSQFMAVNMLAMGALSFEIIFATLILNFRHFIMSISIMDKLRHLPLSQKIPIAFGVTDEAFAIIAMEENSDTEKISAYYVGGIMLFAYISWFTGTLLGGLLSMVIPQSLGDSMAIGIYGMFITLLVPSIRTNYKIALIAGISGGLCYLSNMFFNSGWAIVTATILGGWLGSFLMEEE